MNQHVSQGRTPSRLQPKRALSQGVFILVGLGIIFGGLWTLYMSDAPYHPDANSDIVVAAD